MRDRGKKSESLASFCGGHPSTRTEAICAHRAVEHINRHNKPLTFAFVALCLFYPTHTSFLFRPIGATGRSEDIKKPRQKGLILPPRSACIRCLCTCPASGHTYSACSASESFQHRVRWLASDYRSQNNRRIKPPP